MSRNLTTEERSEIRNRLIDAGFVRTGSTHDRGGDGQYREFWNLGGNVVTISWMPKAIPFPEVEATDLRHEAVRGVLEEGKIYLLVHSHLPRSQDVLFETTGPVRLVKTDYQGIQPKVPFRRKSAFTGRMYTSEFYASDIGLHDVPGVSYKNRSNYVLDLAALEAKGIRVKRHRR